MPEFRRSRNEMDAAGIEAAAARLPGLDMTFVQQRAVEGEADQIFLRLSVAAPFDAFGRAREAANQFASRGGPPTVPAAIDEVEALRWRPALPRPIGENALHWNVGRRAAAPPRLSPP
jgi:hypothetical protein